MTLTGMEGNPNFESSYGALVRIEGKEITFAESENTLRGAQVTATLAVAYEQRTANLIAWMEYATGDDYTASCAEIEGRIGRAGGREPKP